MIAPATASTGTTALMPISGVSAAARSASAAIAASVSGSKSKLARHRPRAAVAVDGDVGERRLGYFHHRGIGRPALGVDLDLDGDRSVADAHQLGIEGQH